MNIFASIATQVVGGAAASYLDQTKPEWTQHVGGVAITPGAIAAAGVMLGLAFLPGGSGATAPAWKLVLANLAGGAFVYEGVKLANEQILPMLQGHTAALQYPPGTVLPNGQVVQGMPYVGAAPQLGYPGWRSPSAWTDYQVQQGYAGWRNAA